MPIWYRDRMKTIRRSVVEEFPWGVYVLQMPDGSVVTDSDDNFLLVQCMKGDLAMIGKLMQAARYYGLESARPVFLSGRYMVSDSEFEHQIERQEQGLIPDPNDPGVLVDYERTGRLD